MRYIDLVFEYQSMKEIKDNNLEVSKNKGGKRPSEIIQHPQQLSSKEIGRSLTTKNLKSKENSIKLESKINVWLFRK